MAGRSLTASVTALLLVVAGALMAPAAQADRQPLLMEGKHTLFQKVLTRPGMDLRAQPAADAQVLEAALPAFSLLYVYDRKDVGGKPWVEVGRTRDGSKTGWLPADATIDWKQTIVAAFSNPAGRERTLLFNTRDGLIDLLESENVVPRAAELRKQAIANQLPPDSGVVSIEPETYIDIAEHFYLLPILQFEDMYLASGFRSKILKVASIPLGINPLQPQRPSREELLKRFKAGIVFVIDTTTSMGPYIDSTRGAIKHIYDTVAASEVGKRVDFGLIAFRDSLKLVPKLDYLTKTYVNLAPDQDPSQVIKDLADVKEATVSSKGFDEDSMAGVNAAIKQVDWPKFDGRYIILITDAGPARSRRSQRLGQAGAGRGQRRRRRQRRRDLHPAPQDAGRRIRPRQRRAGLPRAVQIQRRQPLLSGRRWQRCGLHQRGQHAQPDSGRAAPGYRARRRQPGRGVDRRSGRRPGAPGRPRHAAGLPRAGRGDPGAERVRGLDVRDRLRGPEAQGAGDPPDAVQEPARDHA